MEQLFLGIMYAFVFLFGICIGSFLNVVVYRVPNGISLVKGRSFCPACKEPIRDYDLIPVLSFLILGGRCRHCQDKISPRYPLVELFTGVVAVLLFWKYGFTLLAVEACLLLAVLLPVFLIDMDTLTIPNGLVLCLLVPAALSVFLQKDVTLLSRGIGLICVSVPMYLLTLLIPDCFGGGDIKLMAAAGLLLGWKNCLFAAFVGILLGGLWAIFLLLIRKKGRKEHMAFGPFLCIGIGGAFLFGDAAIHGYFSLFGF